MKGITPKTKLLRKEITIHLSQLDSLKDILGEKKFSKRIKRAAKLLSSNLPAKSKSTVTPVQPELQS